MINALIAKDTTYSWLAAGALAEALLGRLPKLTDADIKGFCSVVIPSAEHYEAAIECYQQALKQCDPSSQLYEIISWHLFNAKLAVGEDVDLQSDKLTEPTKSSIHQRRERDDFFKRSLRSSSVFFKLQDKTPTPPYHPLAIVPYK